MACVVESFEIISQSGKRYRFGGQSAVSIPVQHSLETKSVSVEILRVDLKIRHTYTAIDEVFRTGGKA